MRFSIILCTIPMRKKALERLLESIKKYTTDYEVLIHDEAIKHMTAADAWNELTAKSQGEFLQFMNDDMEVTEGWLDSNADVYEILEGRGEKVGEMESCIWCHENVQTRGGGFAGTQSYIIPGPDEIKKIDYANMPFMRRKVWDDVGPFKAYGTLYCDDAAYGLRCLKKGYTNWYNPISKVIHYTLGQKPEDGEEEVKRRQYAEQVIQKQAKELFLAEWKEWLEKEHKKLY